MGIIDKAWVKLKCRECGTEEINTALDKGSGYSGSAWQTFGPFEHFTVETSGGGVVDPGIESAMCKNCGAAASTDIVYGFKKPDGF